MAGRLVFRDSSTALATNQAQFTFTVQDQSNAFAQSANTLTINRAPEVSSFASQSLVEPTGVGALTTTIPVSFSDRDTGDVGHTISVSGVTALGAVAGLSDISNAQLLSWLTPGSVTKLANSITGSANLTFNAPAGALDYLGQGQILTMVTVVF
jgi:hypothetical protein